MENRSSTNVAGRESWPQTPWQWLERRTAFAFTLAGVLLIGSALAPVGLAAVTDWAWVSGVALAGFAVLAAAAGLLGVYPKARDRTPRLAVAGVLCAAIAGVAALGLLSMAGVALLAEGALGADLAEPTELFVAVALSAAGGLSLGSVLLGTASRRSERRFRTAGTLLAIGGAVLFVPVVGELTRTVAGVGPPPWLFFPALGLFALDTLAVGYSF